MRILGHGLLLGLLLSQAVQVKSGPGFWGAALAGGAYDRQYRTESVDGSGQQKEKKSNGASGSSIGKVAKNAASSMRPSTTTNSATGKDAKYAASSMRPSTTTNRATDSSFNGTSTPSGRGTEGEVCMELHFLVAGAVGIGLVSAAIAFHVTRFFMRGCKGIKKKVRQEEDQVSTQYASLQNLPIKEGHASRVPEQDAEKKTCYATIADIMIEPRPTEDKDTDGASPTENP